MIVSLCKRYWMFPVQVSRELKDLCFTLYLVRYQLKNHRVSILTAKRENMGSKKTQTSPSWFNQQLGRINSIKVLLPGTLTNFAAAKCFSPQNQRMTIDNQKTKINEDVHPIEHGDVLLSWSSSLKRKGSSSKS